MCYVGRYRVSIVVGSLHDTRLVGGSMAAYGLYASVGIQKGLVPWQYMGAMHYKDLCLESVYI